jgi:tetratricopeptide (TPR) repeat protein
MAELLLLALVAGTVGLAIAWPLLDGGQASAPDAPDPEREALELRHRLALEALRDLEADLRAGSLDETRYRAQRDEAEARAAETRRALDSLPTGGPPADAPPTDALPAEMPAPARSARAWRVPALIGGVLALLLLVGYALPAPIGIAERDARLERIRQLTEAVAENPRDTAALAELSDLYIAGGSSEDVARALASLILLRDAAPQSRDAHQRLVTLLIRAGVWEQASAATDRFAEVVGNDDADVPFYRGLVARGTGDSAEAVRQFDRFLQLAPEDPRAQMVQSLREEAARSSAS